MCDDDRVGFLGWCALKKMRKLIDGCAEVGNERRHGGRRFNGQDPSVSQMGEDFPDETDRLGRVLEDHFGQELPRAAIKLFPQPSFDHLDEKRSAWL